MTIDPTLLPPGAVLGGRYVVRSLLGKGGWGAVYEATHQDLGRVVAIKVLLGNVHATERERFRREAQATARLRHPNIVEVFELELTAEPPFLVMERLTGETLFARLSRGPLPREQALDIATQILSALEAAHGMRIVHRDLKPANVFLVDGGARAKVLDFGIAKQADASPLTTVGSMMGTPAYMAPEQTCSSPSTRGRTSTPSASASRRC